MIGFIAFIVGYIAWFAFIVWVITRMTPLLTDDEFQRTPEYQLDPWKFY